MPGSFRTLPVTAMLALLTACGGGVGAPGSAPAPADPAPSPAPQEPTPEIDADVIGMPGARVPGLSANYVTTMLGWLAPEGDVVFEAVIQWKPDNTLGCGILRRAPDGNVHPLLMQGQPLLDTGGVVKHPKLPIEARGDVLVMPAEVEGGAVTHALFAVPRGGGLPRLLGEGTFLAAEAVDGDSVLAQREEDGALLRLAVGQPPEVLHPGCDAGFSTNGRRAVVRDGGDAFVVGLDGTARRILGRGDAVPGTSGAVALVTGAWVNDADAFVLQVRTDDAACPEALLRIADGGTEVLAVCGTPAPGTPDLIDRLVVATGRSPDVVFAAGTRTAGAIVFCARPSELPVSVATDGPGYRIRENEVVVEGARIAFGAAGATWDAVYRVEPGRAPERLAGTDGVVPAAGGAALASFPFPLAAALDLAPDGTALLHAGLVEARRPDATLGALLLVR